MRRPDSRKPNGHDGESRLRPARERRLSAEELALWHHVTRDTLPLDGQKAEPVPTPEPRPAPPTAASAPLAEPAAHSALPAASAPRGIDRRTLQRLKRGLVQIDARLDLHGLTQDEAHRHLTLFLAHHQRQGARCLLVITGLGGRSGGILRRMTPRWLAEPPNAQRVIAHAPAQRRHGGEGALYVLLRRLR